MNIDDQLRDAARAGNVEKIKELLRSGTDINSADNVRNQPDV